MLARSCCQPHALHRAQGRSSFIGAVCAVAITQGTQPTQKKAEQQAIHWAEPWLKRAPAGWKRSRPSLRGQR